MLWPNGTKAQKIGGVQSRTAGGRGARSAQARHERGRLGRRPKGSAALILDGTGESSPGVLRRNGVSAVKRPIHAERRHTSGREWASASLGRGPSNEQAREHAVDRR